MQLNRGVDREMNRGASQGSTMEVMPWWCLCDGKAMVVMRWSCHIVYLQSFEQHELPTEVMPW